MKAVYKIYDFVKSRGVSDQFPEENKLTELMNILAMLTSSGAFLIFLMSYLFDDLVYTVTSSVVTITYLIIIVLHHFNKVHEARFYFAAIVPFWYCCTILIIGGHFGQTIAPCATITVSYLHYKNQPKLRFKLVFYNVLLFVLPTLYINFYGPLLGIHDYPIDEIVVFLLCLGWMSIVFFIHEEKTKKYISSLTSQNKKLEEKTCELERFTYIASHDLKSPLGNISNFLGLMRKDIEKNKHDNLDQYLQFAESGAYRMNELIEGVLEISRNDFNKNDSRAQVNLNKTLKKVIANIQNEIDEKNTIITSNTLPDFHCKEADFIIVFQNLIQNAMKYNTDRKPKIVITSKKTKEEIVLQFTDNGIGIDPKHYDEIFEYFKRLHNHSEYPGTGLGLGLCKKIINKYDGEISVDSVVDAYTSFTITLPIKEIKIDTSIELVEEKAPELVAH